MKNSKNNLNPFEEVASSMRPLFASLQKFLAAQAKAFNKELRDIAKDSISPKGKFIRPALVFAAANADNSKKDSLIRRAAVVELTHLSTLIHDDVLDNASVRRNSVTPNKQYGARTAILLGDAIFAHTMRLAFEENNNQVSLKTTNCVRTICEGEIRQTLANADKKVTQVSRKRYYEIAYGKTAALFELSCALGALCSDAPEGWVETAEEVGKQLGIAYQIYDDICDWFMSESDAGKTLGTDLITGKQTFPLIVLMEKLPSKEAKLLSENLKDSDASEISSLMCKHDVKSECEKEFLRRVTLSENLLAKYPQQNAKLIEFCSAMRKLKLT